MTAELDDETRKRLKEEINFLDEIDNATGLSNTLAKLRDKGAFSQDYYDYSGRNLDVKPHKDRVIDNLPEDRIRLEYRDESGKIMTKK